MARLVNTEVVETKGMTIINKYKDNTEDRHTFFVGDVIENLKYAENNEMSTTTGRLDDVIFRYLRYATMTNAKETNKLAKDARVVSVDIDSSERFYADAATIDAMAILEYDPDTSKEVIKVNVEPIRKVFIKATLSDGSSSEETVYEGMTLFNVIFYRGGKEITGNFEVSAFIYEVPNMIPTLLGFYLKGPDTNYKVKFTSIKYIGKEGIVVTPDMSLAEALANSEGNVTVRSGVYNEDLVFDNDSIYGYYAYTPANIGDRATPEISELETVITGKMTVATDGIVEISGMTFTGNARLDITNAKKVLIKNCKFVGITPDAAKSYLIMNRTFGDNPVHIEINNCYFGDNPNSGSNKMYNLFELNSKIDNGSYINNNYFTAGCCTHNIINLYDVYNDASIEISENHFEYSANAVRIGFIGAPEGVKVLMQSNVYDTTDSARDWAGILIVQPYATRTTTLYGVKVYLNDTRYTAGDDNDQLWYVYCGPTDTQLSDYEKPRIYVNGKNESGNEPDHDGDGEHEPADGDTTPDSDGHFDWYERCGSKTPNALLVVADDTPDEEYDKTKMIKRKMVIADIPDIMPGEFVVYREGIDEL